jgi:hypothetical protein
MSYTAGKHEDGRHYTVFDGSRSLGQRFDTKKQASNHAAKLNWEDEHRQRAEHFAEADIVKLRDVPAGKFVRLLERSNDGPPDKPYRKTWRCVTVRGKPSAGASGTMQVPCENSDGATVLLSDDTACRILR